MEKEKMNEFLKEQLERVNYWLSFGEAKNGALIAFNMALMAMLIELFKYAPLLCTITLICLVLSNCMCLLSFVPDLTSHNAENKNSVDINSVNLLFYSDIAKLDKEQYIDALKTKYTDLFKESSLVGKRELDYVSEIYTNSCIAARKYHLFRKAVHIDLIAMVLVAVSFMVA